MNDQKNDGERARIEPRQMRLAIAASALGLIGLGALLIYPPSCPLAVGSLLWIDLTISGILSGRRRMQIGTRRTR